MGSEQRLIAIVGVDGSGKSSVIDAVQLKLAALGYGVQVLAKVSKPRRTETIANHALPLRSPALSLLKLLWRSAEWAGKYYFRYAPWLRKGNLILCDRFYFDELLLDPLKYRYAGTAQTVHRVRSVLPSPDMYILLDAPEQVLYARKQEVPFEEVGRLRQAYLAWVKQQPRGHCVDAAAPLDRVIENTCQIVVDYLRQGAEISNTPGPSTVD